MKKLNSQLEPTFRLDGIYIGEVVGVLDEKERDRVQLRILGLIDDDTPDSDCPWAEQGTSIFGGTDQVSGFSSVPKKGSFVYVQFLHGDPSKPIYFGYVRGLSDASEAQKGLTNAIIDARVNGKAAGELDHLTGNTEYPNNNVIETSAGMIEIDDTTGNERITITHISGSHIEIRPDGKVVIKSGDELNVVAPKIFLGGNDATEPIVLGNELKTQVENLVTKIFNDFIQQDFNTLTVIGNLGAPTSPPTTPSTASMSDPVTPSLSSQNKSK